MNKLFLALGASFLLLPGQSIATACEGSQSKRLKDLQTQVYYYQNCFSSRSADKLRAISALSGVAAAFFRRRQDSIKAVPFSLMAFVSGAASLYALWSNPWDRSCINKVLQANDVAKIQHLSKKRAMLIIAARNQDIELMRILSAGQKDFLARENECRALVSLYYRHSGVPTEAFDDPVAHIHTLLNLT